jgi:arsenate reductase
MIRNSGEEPTVIDYLQHPPSRELLANMIKDAGLSVREAIRKKDTPYAELGLDKLISRTTSCWMPCWRIPF